jgi:hypothetical protein
MLRNRQSRAVAGGCLVLMAALPTCAASAETFESSYTSIVEKKCRKFDVLNIGDNEYAASRVCAGRGGYKVFINEDDLRATLTVGKTLRQAGKEPVAHEHYGAFNDYEDKVEWRSGRDGNPFAIIVGWSFADNENTDATGRPKSARLLVVMRLPPGPVCKVAYVDRAANGDANVLARKAADDIARTFKCGTDTPQVIGKRGRAIEAMSRGGASVSPPGGVPPPDTR